MVLDRQRRAGVHGLQDLRLRRRPRGRLGARPRLLGPREEVPRRRALQRRPQAREPAGGGADGPDLREPRGPERQARSARRREGHPRDLRPHGDERRRDRRAHRRRPHLRQGARRRTLRPSAWARAGRRRRRAAGPRLEEQVRQGQRPATRSPAAWKAPGRPTRPPGPRSTSTTCSPSSGCRRRARPARPSGFPRTAQGANLVPDAHDPVEAPRADHVHDRPGAEVRPGLPEDREALPGEPGGVRARLRQGLVQADPPRHGPARALPRRGGSAGGADLAGPGARASITR